MFVCLPLVTLTVQWIAGRQRVAKEGANAGRLTNIEPGPKWRSVSFLLQGLRDGEKRWSLREMLAADCAPVTRLKE